MAEVKTEKKLLEFYDSPKNFRIFSNRQRIETFLVLKIELAYWIDERFI